MLDTDKNLIDEQDSDYILMEMDTKFLDEEIKEQFDNILDSSKTDILSIFIKKYKLLKKSESDDADFIEKLKFNKHLFVEEIFKRMKQKFKFKVQEDDEIKFNVVKALYNIFVLSYNDTLVDFIVSTILRNKKTILNEIKGYNKDLGFTANKLKYKQNDAIIISNINKIIFDIIPSIYDDESYMKPILANDDSIYLYMITRAMDEHYISFNYKSYKAFLKPLVKKKDGYIDIINNVIIKLSKTFSKEQINIL